MFTLLAEMSLADRRRKLEAARSALNAAFQLVPEHLQHGRVGSGDFDHAGEDELGSLAARDIFRKKVLETYHGADPFDPDTTNPFVEFLRNMAKDIGSEEIEADWPCRGRGRSGTAPPAEPIDT